MWFAGSTTAVEEFPAVGSFPLLLNYLRRFNEFSFDFRQKPPSRLSMEKYRRQNRSLVETKFLRPSAKLSCYFGLETRLENYLEAILTSYNRSQTALEKLQTEKPDLILSTAPFQSSQPAIVSVAKKLKIPVLALIPSWDNLSTKNRMVFKYDGYLVWSEQMKAQLHEYYEHSRQVPVYVTGATQFDVFFQPQFRQSRKEFCASQNLDPKLPVIVYALGSPNFLKEHHGAVFLAEKVMSGELGEVQMLIRPHPLFDKGELGNLFDRFAPRVRLQQTHSSETDSDLRSQDKNQITEWINTFRHADVVVNLSSTVTVDAAIFDRPVVNLDFDPQPESPDQVLIKEINHLWTHFKPVAESGGVWLVNNFDELVEAVKGYLKNPSLHREKRRWIAHHVCGHLDGKCGARMAEAIADFISLSSPDSHNRKE